MLFLDLREGENPFPAILRRILDGRGIDQSFLRIAFFTTLAVVFTAQVVSLLIGVIVAISQLSSWRVLRVAGTMYVETLRGLPIYVMLLFVYFGVRTLLRDVPFPFAMEGFTTDREPFKVSLSPFVSAVIALGVCYGAYMGEVIRAGILAIPAEEIEAASLEAGRFAVLAHIILPQAFRIVQPAVANECIALLKDSSLVGAVTLIDITRSADIHARSTFRYFETFSALALVYLLLSLILSRVQRELEKRFGTDKKPIM